MKHLYYRLLTCFFFLSTFGQHALAQGSVTFHDPSSPFADDFTIGNISISSRNTLQISTAQTLNFSGTLYRPHTLINEGQVDIYLGDAAGNLSATPLALTPGTGYQRTNQSPWSGPNSSNIDSHPVAGRVEISPAIIGSYTTLYAVFINTNDPNNPRKEAVTARGIPVKVPVSGPSITSLSPAKALSSANTAVTISGTSLNGATQVLFGSASLSFSVNSATQINATIPAGYTPGQYSIKVVTTNGTSNSLPFNVIAPATTSPNITSLTPSSGPIRTAVTITGSTDWAAYSSIEVYFGNTQSTVSVFGNNITTQVPAGLPLGVVPVTVKTSTGTSNGLTFNVTAPPPAPLPTIGLTPLQGATNSRVVVKFSGNAQTGTLIDINGISSSPYSSEFDGEYTYLKFQIPRGATTGPVSVKSSTGSTLSQSVNFTIVENAPAEIIYGTASYGSMSGGKIHLYTYLDWQDYNSKGYSKPVVSFNGVLAYDVEYDYITAKYDHFYLQEGGITVTIPIGATSGLVTIINQFGTGKGIGVNLAFATSLPCGKESIICSDQCAQYGIQPKIIHGRVSADNNSSPFKRYRNACSDASIPTFASGDEYEWVQWQYSFDQTNWTDISGATQDDYQPGPLTRTTYYRRASTHLVSRWWGGKSREHWYTSETVTVSVGGKPPVASASTYNLSSCGNTGQIIRVAVDQNYDNTYTNKSYNWRTLYPGWTVNGYSTVTSGGYYATNNDYVDVFVPGGTAPGTYYLLVSGNGACGTESASTYITFNLTQDPIGAPTSVRFEQNANTSKCTWWYDATCPIVPGATSYSANGVSGQIFPSAGFVYFPLNYLGGSDVTISITTANSCGPGQTFTTTEYLYQADYNCDDNNNYIVMYPNPTSEGVKFNNGGLVGQATFYDAQGIVRKVVTLREKQVETDVNVLDLPNGTYHVRVTTKGKTRFSKQLVVQH